MHKIAAAMAPRLVGQRLARLETGGTRSGAARDVHPPLDVQAVYAHGKHLLVDFEDSSTLRSHLGLHGSWHRYPRGARWRRPDRQARVILGTHGEDFVCFNPREVEWLLAHSARRSDQFSRLGPDLLAPDFDPCEAVRRAHALCDGPVPLVDVLLDQRIAAGIGNVYKSELLFMCRHDPLGKLAQTSSTQLEALYTLAAELLRRNLHGGRRNTRQDAVRPNRAGRADALWVYGRGGKPCLRCAAPVQFARVGATRRATWWCAKCQAP